MKEYVLLLPILFIFHDMEEIIGFGWFFRNNKQLLERFSKITAAYNGFTTEGFALAVYEEFIPFFGISLLAYFFPGDVLYALWFGLLLALTIHFLMHIGLSIYIRKYIPSLITSIICLPICLVILMHCIELIVFDLQTVGLITGGIVGTMINLKFLHYLMQRFGEQIHGN